jgi:hypothetical protein
LAGQVSALVVDQAVEKARVSLENFDVALATGVAGFAAAAVVV